MVQVENLQELAQLLFQQSSILFERRKPLNAEEAPILNGIPVQKPDEMTRAIDSDCQITQIEGGYKFTLFVAGEPLEWSLKYDARQQRFEIDDEELGQFFLALLSETLHVDYKRISPNEDHRAVPETAVSYRQLEKLVHEKLREKPTEFGYAPGSSTQQVARRIVDAFFSLFTDSDTEYYRIGERDGYRVKYITEAVWQILRQDQVTNGDKLKVALFGQKNERKTTGLSDNAIALLHVVALEN